MAINRFWNNDQQAEYIPRTMQEIMYAPKIMYDREQELSGKVDAMNESNATLKAMLGDKAGASEKFDSGYKDIIEGISKYGATNQMLDKAKALRLSYINEVVPQEAFAKKREAIIASQMKDRSDQNNIITGNNASDISFDQYRKDPNAFQYQVAQRDKLIQDGMQAGAQIGEEENNSGVHVDEFGKLVIPPKFVNAGEFHNAYQNNPEFKTSIDQQATAKAKARGIQNPSKEILNTIISGMATTASGKVKRENISEYELQRLRTAGLKPAGGVDILSFNDVAIPNPASGSMDYPVDKDIAMKSPIVKKKYDAEIFSKSGGEYKSQEEMDTAKKQLEIKKEQLTRSALVSYGATVGHSSTDNSYRNKIDNQLRTINDVQKKVDENFFKANGWAQTTSIDINNGNKSWLPDKMQNDIDDSKKGAVQDAEKFFPSWTSDKVEDTGPSTIEDVKFFNEYMKDPDRKIAVWKDLRINGAVGDKEMVGTGQINPVFHLEFGTGKKRQQKDVSFNFPPQETIDLLNPLQTAALMLSPHTTDTPERKSNSTIMANYMELYKNYLTSKNQVNTDRANKLKQ